MDMEALKSSGKSEEPSNASVQTTKETALSSSHSYPYTFGKQASAFTELRESSERLPFSGAQAIEETPK